MPRWLRWLTVPVLLAFVAGAAIGAVIARWGNLPAWGAVLPAATALAGVALGQFMTSERDARERRARERDVERDLVAEITLAAIGCAASIGSAIDKVRSGEQAGLRYLNSSPDGTRFQASINQWDRSTAKGRLFLHSGDLNRLLDDMIQQYATLFSEHVGGLADGGSSEEIDAALAALQSWTDGLKAFRDHAVSVLAR